MCQRTGVQLEESAGAGTAAEKLFYTFYESVKKWVTTFLLFVIIIRK